MADLNITQGSIRLPLGMLGGSDKVTKLNRIMSHLQHLKADRRHTCVPLVFHNSKGDGLDIYSTKWKGTLPF